MTDRTSLAGIRVYENAGRRFCLLLLIFLAFVAARSRPVHPAPPEKPRDVFSAANDTVVWTDHLALDLTVDFDAHTIRGSATHRIVNPRGAAELILDTRDLDIESIQIDGVVTTWRLGDLSANGRALTIDIQPNTELVRVNYRTRPSSSALHWLTAKQTKGRVMPALYTQGQPDHTRSWIPVQDSPGVRMTWSATVHVPERMLALMSAPNPTEIDPSGTYHFEMPQTVPAYLIVISVGRYTFRPLGPMTGIYAEPELIDDAVYEMQFLPDMFAVAQEILGPYPWERYDLLFPPQFGGGMENTTLNFIAPDHISGDHPDPVLSSGLIAHELAHSWIGDMLTCATWSDTWLNEGGATYYEKRILEVMAGPERSEVGYYYDRRVYEEFLRDNPTYPARLTMLHRTFVGEERPGNAFNLNAYQKGELFLKMLEDHLGRTTFDAFMAGYIEKNRFHWVDDQAFLRSLRLALRPLSAESVSALELDTWLYGTGLPDNVTAPVRSAIVDRVAAQAAAYESGTNASMLDTAAWTQLEFNLFLQMITIAPSRMSELDSAFGFSSKHSPHILWLLALARTRAAATLPVLEGYLMRGTSNALSIWALLGETSSGRQYARPIYSEAREFYTEGSQFYIELSLGLRTTKGAGFPPMRFDHLETTDIGAKQGTRAHP